MTDDLIDYLEECDRLRERIKELEEGACRFNCATRKKAFMAGWEALDEQWAIEHFSMGEYHYDPEIAYKEWRNEQ